MTDKAGDNKFLNLMSQTRPTKDSEYQDKSFLITTQELPSCAAVQFTREPGDLITSRAVVMMLCFMAKNSETNRALEKHESAHIFVFDAGEVKVNFGLQWSGWLGHDASNNWKNGVGFFQLPVVST